MTEGLFILTTIFVAYVVYQVVNDRKQSAKSNDSDSETVVKTAAAPVSKPQSAAKKEDAVVKSQPSPKKDEPAPAKSEAAVKKAETPMPKPLVAEPPTVSASATALAAPKTNLRDPKTGEVTSGGANYRFTKRWIKEALVAEGLLTKVYKNNELDSDIEAKIKEAMVKLEAMDKYRA